MPYKLNHGIMIWNDFFQKALPENWVVTTLDKYISFGKGISYSSSDIEKSEGMPMINLASIDISRNYKPSELKYYTGLFSEEKMAFPGELLIACTDLTRNADIIGSPIIVPFGLYPKYL